MAAAAGPLIGGFMTTYLSWRYVFVVETIVMVIVLIAARSFKAGPKAKKLTIDKPSAILSALGLTMVVYGMLQAKVWGLIQPIAKPEIAGHPIAPLGISVVAYLILGGLIVLKIFYDRQAKLEESKQNPLLRVSLLKISALRSGLAVLGAQYAITAGVFFIIPIYLQMVIGLDALQTGIKIFPLSVALILASLVGSRLVKKFSPQRIVRIGQLLLLFGSIALLAAVDPELTGLAFAAAMFSVGAGLGLLASQIGNVTMSAVDLESSNEVGGMSGTFQNLGSSLGTAIIGSVLVVSLTSGFISRIDQSNLPPEVKTPISQKAESGVAIVSASEVTDIATSKGLSQQEANEVATIYEESQLAGLKEAIFFLIAIAALSILLSRNIPNQKVA
jgi:predicted MFS family arabinose efflux permease